MRWLFPLAGLLLAHPATAQSVNQARCMGPASTFPMGCSGGYGPQALGGYTGPGDIVSGATAWYSSARGYNRAYALPGTNKALNLRNGLTNATADIVVRSNGNVDVATANALAGPDGGTGVCTASTIGSSTTLTITTCAASATLHAGDTLTCASCVQPVFISALGTFTGTGAGAAGTVTLNAAQNVTAQSVTSQVALYVTTAYDQSGTNGCSSAPCNMTQATTGKQPQWLPTVQNGQPGINLISASSQNLAGLLPSSVGGNTSKTLVFVGGYKTANIASQDMWSFGAASAQAAFGIGTDGSRNLSVFQFAADCSGTTINDALWHVFRATKTGSNLDITQDTTSLCSSTPTAANITTYNQYMGSLVASNYWSGATGEWGLWPSAISSSGIQANAKGFYNTP